MNFKIEGKKIKLPRKRKKRLLKSHNRNIFGSKNEYYYMIMQRICQYDVLKDKKCRKFPEVEKQKDETFKILFYW